MSQHDSLCPQFYGGGLCICLSLEYDRHRAILRFWGDFNKFMENYVKTVTPAPEKAPDNEKPAD